MTKIIKILIIIFGLFLQIKIYSHPVHYSLTNIDYNTSIKQIYGIIKIFKDDLWLAILHNYEKFNINDTCCLLNNNFFIDYFNNRFQIYVDTFYFDPKIKEIYYEDSFIIIKFFSDLQNSPKKICINNNLLFDIYLDQLNMLIFSIDNKEEKGYMIYSYTGDICIDL